MKKNLLTLFCILTVILSKPVLAQTMQDGLKMSNKQLCVVAQYQTESWKEYWEGTRFRTNPNLGTFTANSVTLMAAYGISEKLNVIAMLPYIQTSATAGTMRGQSGLQDLSVALKYDFLDYKKFRMYGVLGASTPVSKYIPDFLPFSIGLQAKTASFRLIAHQKIGPLHITGQAGYVARTKITVDRTNYFTDDNIIYSNSMAVPDITNVMIRVGMDKKAFLAEAFIEQTNCLTGSDIRRFDTPLPVNKMDFTRVGIFVTWHTPIKNVSLNFNASQVLDGRNVGKSTMLGGQLQYIINNKTSNLTK